VVHLLFFKISLQFFQNFLCNILSVTFMLLFKMFWEFCW